MVAYCRRKAQIPHYDRSWQLVISRSKPEVREIAYQSAKGRGKGILLMKAKYGAKVA